MARGLIFDCDGVLVDSEPLAVIELCRMLADQGVAIDGQRIYDDFLGRSIGTLITAASQEFGRDIAPAMPDYSGALAQRFRAELRPIPGMIAALQKLDGPRAVASSSAPERLNLSLDLTGIAPLFGQHIYSASMVVHGKPAPDLFLMAASRIGVAPQDCIVIEDSPAGVQAARAAGMRVLGFVGGGHAVPARLADRLAALSPDGIVEHADDLPDTLAKMQ